MSKERKPLLSNADLVHSPLNTPEGVRAFYEDKITSGELRVLDQVERIETKESEFGFLDRCSKCEAVLSPMDNFCPGCGNPIKP